jgi:hypothetical protein
MRPQSLKEAIERILLAGEEERIAIADFWTSSTSTTETQNSYKR